MDRFFFVHAADLHLDTPFRGIEAEAPEVASALRDASLDAWDGLVELCVDRGAEFLLLAGDLYDGDERGIRAQLRFEAGLVRLRSAGVDVFAVQGNHDPCDEGWSAIGEWPPGVTFFGHEAATSVGVERAGGRLATIHGISYGTRETTENLALGFARGAEPGLHIGLLHCNVGGSGEHAPYSPCSLEELASAGMDYWALGHIHRFQVLAEGRPWVVYPGALQGRSPKPSERGAKGAAVVEVVGGAIAAVELAPVDRIRFVEVEVDGGACDDFSQLAEVLRSALLPLREEHGDRGLVVRGSVRGRTPLAGRLGDAGERAGLLAGLRDAAEGARPLVWWESLRSEARSPIDREAVKARADFAGGLVALCDELTDDTAALSDFERSQTDMLSAALREELPLLGGDERAELLRVAEGLALDLLQAGEPE